MQPITDDADFSLEVRRAPGGVDATVHVGGDLDLVHADQLDRVVRAEMDRGPVLLHLGAVTFIDSSGLRVIDGLVRHSRAGGGELRIDPALPERVAQILELTGMLGILPLAGRA